VEWRHTSGVRLHETASVSNLTIERDRLRITFTSGTIQFSQAVAGRVCVATFQGQGRLQVTVPHPREAQQLDLLLKGDSVDFQFTDAVLNFSSDAFDELARQLTWSPSNSGNLADLYRSRMHEWEERGSPLQPRIVQSLLSAGGKRDAFLDVELKTDGRGWMMVGFDARKAEEVTLDRWADRDYVGQYDTWLSFPAGNRDGGDAFRDPLEKASFFIRSYPIHWNVGSGTDLSATSTVKIDCLSPGDHFLVFDLNPNLRVDSVKDETGAALPYFQPREPKGRTLTYGAFLGVALPASMQAGGTHTRIPLRREARDPECGSGKLFCSELRLVPGRPAQQRCVCDAG
jgi:hypothetical protein